MPGIKNVMISAGEASGDMHGSNLVRELLRLDPDMKFFGMGGDMMKSTGVNIFHHVRDMAVVGIFEVMNKLPVIRKAMKDMEGLMDILKPEVLILIDYPGFNLRLAKKAKERGIKVICYISPQVWAWHKGRIKTIARYVDKMLVAFPFEHPLYRAAGVDVEFVGHPLMDSVPLSPDRGQIRGGLGFRKSDTVIGLLPGSRRREVDSLFPEMIKAAELIYGRRDGVRFAVPVARTLDAAHLKGFVQGSEADIRIYDGRAYDIMAASDFLLAKSGTATLEAAIIGTPMLITYKVSPLTFILANIMVDVEFVGLPNIIAGKGVVPELIQGDATGERMAEEVLNIITDTGRYALIKEELKKVREELGGPGASRRAAEIVYKAV